ncbi:leukotoxin LktA family filamentous adhesin [Stenotrophomonas sp. Iso1]|uniref:leukotoxin LktA family filamentous adhesin n=1 Tax=Stenotrophomonas sp. Iso1 TaxID=2977283 RepID=UPI0022B7A8BF|nr:leukotoxin LktA family filamentous adhesin [Stenotrophomonas sp. Iso1]
MNRINATSKNRPSAKTSMRGELHPRPAGLAAAIGSVLGIALPLTVWAGDAGSSITTDGNTATTVTSTAQDRWKVATSTIKGRQPGNQVAFNSFKDFGVEAGQTVDLILPTKDGAQVHNLVNLVSDSRAYINGNLNGFLADESTVGGRVFFVDPHGLLVGKSGVLNVGSLSVATPTRAVMDDILAAGEGLDGLMYGTLKPEQLSRTGVVTIDGTINASNGVRVQARAIDVTGTILVAVAPAAGRDANASLQRVDETAVNTGGAGAPLALVNDGGKIQLRAAAISDTGLGVRSAEATVTVGGVAKLSADDIELTATAVVDSGYDKDSAAFDEVKADLTGSLTDMSTLQDLGDALVNLGVDKVLGEQISFLHASTTARVEVKDSATLEARNDIALHASTRQNIDNSAAGTAYEKGDFVTDANGDPVKDATGNPVPKKHLLSLGAAYGQINATTEAIIRSGARVEAGGDVSVKADADTAMKLAAESFAVNNTTAAFTAAISNVNVDTKAVIEAGNAPITAGSVNVSAVNTSSIETSATARADNQGAVGLAGAISLQDIAAEARLNRNVTTHTTGGNSGDVTVQAASITSLNKTSTLVAGPKSEPLPGQEQVEAISSGGDGLMTMAQSLAGAGIGAALGKISGDSAGGGSGGGTTPTTPPKPAPFRLGGAISFVDGEHTAKASIGANAQIISAGDIVVDSQVIDAQIGNHAISNVLAKGKSADGSAFALSGAITIANLEHDAQTLVGSGAQLSAAHIGLASDVRLPRDFSALTGAVPNFSSFDAFKDSLSAAKDLITDPSDLFTSYSAAKGSAEEVAIGGAVSYFKAKNSARTDVASGASLKTTDTSGTPWTAALDGDDHAGDARTRTFDAATDISATTDVTALHAAGDLALKNLKTSNVGKGGTALGGSVGYMDYDNTAAVIVNDGVSIDAGAGSIAIDAANKETIVSLALQSGQGGSIGVSGTASALDLDSRTLAGVSNRATLTGGKIGISADEDMFVWSVAGAVAMSDSISVGASVAYQQMDTDTHAFIGAIPADFKTGSSGATGQVNTGDLSVKANSEGLSGAVAAAGAIAKSSSEQLKQQQDALAQKQNAENPGFLDSLKTRALGKVTALESMGKKADSDGSAGLTQYFDKAKGLLGSGGGQPGQGAQTPQPKFGIALSGSATVNRARQNTKADISGAVVKDNSGNGVKLDITAINKTLLVSISGALSVAAAGSDNSQGSASLAGGVAYGDIQNTTTAGLLSSSVQDAGDVTVTARNESEQVNVGLSVGVNASSDQTTAAAGAISATVAMSKNETAATLRGSSIQGKAGAAGDVDVKAVNESKIANGGGALYAGGKAGMGAAVTYAEIKDDTRAGISGGSIHGVNDVRVRAADASRIVAAAASGGASTQSNGVAIAGSVLVNQVANTTIASINDGASISFDGDLEAFAGTASISDVRATTDGCDSGAGVDYCGNAIGGIQVDANADNGSKDSTSVDAAGRNAGKSSIIAVAGMMQVGGNNAGVAFAYNTIKNTHAVSVNDATLTATSAGNIVLTAADKADILAVSAGIGGSTGNFTGVGSASYNAIGNTTAVRVGSNVPGAPGTALNAGNITLDASDESFIGSFAGAATLGSKVAVGAALTINDIGNGTLALAEGANLDADSGNVALKASNKAKILSGAVAAGAANNVAIQGSVGWSTIANTAEAALRGGTLKTGGLGLHANNSSKVYTLAGAVAGSGTAAIGAAINVATIGDTTRATVDGTALEVTGKLDVIAAADATTKTLAIAGALAGTASIAGSNASNFINSTTEASLNNVIAQGAGVTGDVTVSADTDGKTYSLAGALAVGGTAGVGAASSVNSIGGSTTARIAGSVLDGAKGLDVEAESNSLIRTAAVSGAGAGAAAVAGSVTTNFITTDTLAELKDTRLDSNSADVRVVAKDGRSIDSLAGAAAVAGTVGVGAAVAFNQIGGSTRATLSGGSKGYQIHARDVEVSAQATNANGAANIRTIAAGLGGGGMVGGAASVAVNLMEGEVKASIADGADVVADRNVTVKASQQQGIDVWTGSVAVGGGAAGVGLGTVVNLMTGKTSAQIAGAQTKVSALAWNGGHGLTVDAATRQAVSTVGMSAAVTFAPIVGQSIAVMAGVNVIGTATEASIISASINQHDLRSWVGNWLPAQPATQPGSGSGQGTDGQGDFDFYSASAQGSAEQNVQVRANSTVSSNSVLTGAAAGAGGSASGAASSTVLQTSTVAKLENANVAASGDIGVDARASQSAQTTVVGVAAGLVGGAGTGVVNVFSSNTDASVVGGKTRGSSLTVNAENTVDSSINAGTGAAGAAAVAGTLVVNLAQTRTGASIGRTGVPTLIDVDGKVAVSAHTDTRFVNTVVSGALGGGAAIAGMAQYQQIANTTEAGIFDATVTSGGVDVSALEELEIKASSGVVAGGLGTGVGAAANITLLGSKVAATISGGDIHSGGAVNVDAASVRDIQMTTATAGIGMSTGIGGAASVLLSGIGDIGDVLGEVSGTKGALNDLASSSKLDSSVTGDAALAGKLDSGHLAQLNGATSNSLLTLGGKQDQVIAAIKGARVDAHSVDVNAQTKLNASNTAGAIAAGGLGAGGAVAYSGLFGQTSAAIDGGTVNAGNIAVTAHSGSGNNQPSSSVNAVAGAAGLVGLGAAVAWNDLGQTTTASVSGNLTANGQGGNLNVSATDQNSARVDATGAAVGALAAGAVIAHVSRNATVAATVGANTAVAGFEKVGLNALHGGGVTANGIGAVGGLAGAVNAVVVLAKDNSAVNADVGDLASIITQGSGDAGDAKGDGSSLKVAASSDATVRATGLGVTVSAGAAVGAVVVDAQATTALQASLGNRVNVSGDGDVSVTATRGGALANGDGVYAKATAGAGGIYFAANAASATAGDNSQTVAKVGNDVVIGDRGNFNVVANSTTRQRAEATGITVGGLALGAALANATSNTRTAATIGTNLGGVNAGSTATPKMMGSLSVLANGNDTNLASTFAGGGGLISGAASVATTNGKSNVDATVGANAGRTSGILADSITVSATHEGNYGGSADSTNAAIAGASGSAVRNTVDSTVNANVGNGARLFAAKDLSVTANNLFKSTLDGAAVVAAAGGVFNGSAALIDTKLIGKTTAAVGDNVMLRSGVGGDPNRAGNIDIVARTKVMATDKAQLSTGGAIQVAVVDTSMKGNFNNAVRVGNNAKLSSLGYLNLGTTTTGSLNSQALVNTWGLAAVGTARSEVDAQITESVDVGSNGLLQSLQNAYLSAGKDGTGLLESNLLVNASAEGYVRGLVAVPVVKAVANSNAQMRAAIGAGSTLISSGDVYMGTWGDYFSHQASGRATGYQLGFIPVTVTNSSSEGSVVGNVLVNGKVVAGTANDVNLTIGNNFSCSTDLGIGYACLSIGQLKALDAGFDPGQTVNDADNVLLIDDIYAAGADVYLKGTNINIGSTGSVEAHGAPSVDIVNNSTYHLAFGNIYIPDYAGGNVLVSGTISNGTDRITSDSSGSNPHINIFGNYNLGNGTSILQMGVVNSIGADVRYETKKGSIVSGPVYAASFNTVAPNGTFMFNDPTRNKSVASAEGLWSEYLKGLLGGAYSSADKVAGLLANLQYGGGATNTEQLNNNLFKQPGDASYGGTAIIVYGACLPHVGGSRCGTNQPGYTDYTTFPYNYEGSVKIPTVAYVGTRNGTASYGSNAAIANDNSAIRAREVNIRAKYIDINGTIEAGAGIDWSVKIVDNQFTRGWLQMVESRPGVYDVPTYMLETVGRASSLIGVKYDSVSKRFIVDDVNASGGGKVTLDGSIVSTTNKGKINVTSGFGRVEVGVDLDRDVQLSGMNVATGQDGVVQIIDRLKKGANNQPYTVWYVQQAGKAAAAYDNAICGAACTTWEDASQISNTTTYKPKEGMRYRWNMSARVGRKVDWDSGTAGTWRFLNSSGLEASGAQRWNTGNGTYYQDTPGGADFAWDYSGSFNSYSSATVGYGCGVVQKGCNFGFPEPSNGLHWDPSREGGDGGWETWYRYRMPTDGNLTLNASVRADNPISIGFVTRDKGSVDVSVGNNLYLNGTINNKAGTTTLESRNGSIIQGNDRATLYAQELVLKANNNIGALAGQAIDVALSDGGTLKATTKGGDIALDIHSDATLRLNAGNSQSGYGNVSVIASGDIKGIGGDAVSIVGSNINLVSTTGSIGSISKDGALVIGAHETLGADNRLRGGNVVAVARNDVSLKDVDGDFWVGKVTALTGDVYLEAAAGSLLDASQREDANALTDSQIADIRTRLKLDGGGVADTVATYERQVESRYAEYWNLKSHGEFVGGVFVPDSTAIDAFRARATVAAGAMQSDAQILAYIASMAEEVGAQFAELYGSGWATQTAFQTRDAGYNFVLDTGSDTYSKLAARSKWDDDQLRFAISASALEPAKSSSGSVTEPTISGRNVELVARDSLGRLAESVDVDYARVFAGNLSSQEAMALAMATAPGDVQLIGHAGQVISIDELRAMSEAELQAGPVASIRIKQTSPLYVAASGSLTAKAGDAAYLHATNDLAIAALDVGGSAQIAVEGNLTGATANAMLSVGGDLALETKGDIGQNIASANPSLLNLKLGGTLSGNAGGAMGIRQHGGDLVFDSLYSGDRMRIDVADGSLLSTSSSLVTLRSEKGGVELTARDDIRAVDGGSLNLQLDSGKLDGVAGGEVRISSPKNALNIGSLVSGRDMLIGSISDLTATLLRSGGALYADAKGIMRIGSAESESDVALSANGDLSADSVVSRTGDASLVAGGGVDLGDLQAATVILDAGDVLQLRAGGRVAGDSIVAKAGSLDMGNGARMQAGTSLSVDTTGDMTLGQLQVSAAAGAGTLDLVAGGGIVGNGDGQVNLLSGNDVQVNIAAQTGIGQTGERLTLDGGQVNASTQNGDAMLSFVSAAQIGTVQAQGGNIDLLGAADVDFGLLQASGDVRVDAVSLQGGDIDAGGGITAETAGAMDLHNAMAGAGMQLTAGGALSANGLQSNDAMTLSSGNTLDVKQLTSGAHLDADAVGTLSIADAKVTGNAAIDGQADVVLGQAVVGQALAVDAGTDLTATTLDVTGNSTLTSGGDTSVTTFKGRGDLSAKAGGDLALGTGTVGGNATLSSIGSTTIDTLSAQGSLDATSGAALAARTLSSGASMTLSSGNTLDVQQLTSGANLDADAVGTLSIADAKVTGNAAIDGQRDVVLGQAVVGQTLAVNAATDLTATTLDVVGNSTLTSGGDTSVTTFNGRGDLTAKAGGDLALGTGTVGGNATLASVGSTTIDTLSAQGSLDATSGAALAARTLSSGASMTLASGNTLDVQQLTSGANLDADAVDTLSIADAKVTGNAAIDSQADVVLGQAVVGQTLAVNAATDLTATTLDVTGNSTLTSGGDTSVTTFNGRGDLSAKADGDLALGNGTVGGNATLSSIGRTTIDTLSAQGSLDATSGAALAARTLSSGASMTLSSGNTLDVQQLTSGANLDADAVGTLSIADAKVTGNAAIDGQADVVLGQAVVGQALAVNAATDLTATTLDVTGNSTLTSGGDTSVTTFNGQSDLSAKAGGDLALGNGTVGGNATLSSIGSTTIDTLSTQGSLDATSGAALAARTLSSGASMTLSSGNTLDVQQLTSGANLDADAVGTLSIADAKVTGNASIDGQADVVLGQAVVGQTLAVNAAADLTVTTLDVTGNSTLTSGGDTSVTTFNGQGDLTAKAGDNAAFETVTVGGSMHLQAGKAIDVGTAVIGVDATWVAGTDLTADEVTTGCNFSGDAGGTLAIGSVKAGCGLQLASTESLSFDSLQAGADIGLTSRRGDVQGRSADAGGSLQVNAATAIGINTAMAGTDITANSGGAQQWGSYRAGRDARLTAVGDVVTGSGDSGGLQSITSGGSIHFDRIQAGTTASMDAQGGSLTGGVLRAASGDLAARDHLSLAAGMVDTRLNLAATDITAHITQSSQGQGPLTTTLTGYRNGVAHQVVVEVDPRDAWLIDQIKAVDAQLASTAARADIAQGYIEKTMTLASSGMKVLMDNTSPVLRSADVQLTQLDKTFRLSANGTFLDTNAYVVRFADGFRVTSPNYNPDHVVGGPDYLGESAVRYMSRMLRLETTDRNNAPASGWLDDGQEKDDVISSADGAVNLGAPN